MAVAFGLDRDAIPGILVHPSNVPSEGVAYSIAALVICGSLPRAHANYVEDCALKKVGLLL